MNDTTKPEGAPEQDGQQALVPAPPTSPYPVFMPELGYGLTLPQIARTLSVAGFFGKGLTQEQAMAKIMVGRELGMTPLQAIQNVYVFDGHIQISGNWQATMIRRTPGYDYKVIEHTIEICTIEFYIHGELAGTSSYSMDDARRAGLASKDVWKAHPRNMLFNRAMSNGRRWYAPETLGSLMVYDRDEIEEIADRKRRDAQERQQASQVGARVERHSFEQRTGFVHPDSLSEEQTAAGQSVITFGPHQGKKLIDAPREYVELLSRDCPNVALKLCAQIMLGVIDVDADDTTLPLETPNETDPFAGQ